MSKDRYKRALEFKNNKDKVEALKKIERENDICLAYAQLIECYERAMAYHKFMLETGIPGMYDQVQLYFEGPMDASSYDVYKCYRNSLKNYESYMYDVEEKDSE